MKSAFLLIAVAACAAAAAPARADDAAAGDALIVKLAPSERTEVRDRADVRPAGHIDGLPGVDVVVPADGDRARALDELRDDPAVAWAEPVRSRSAFVNDALMGVLWGLDNTGQAVWSMSGLPDADIGAPAAWSVSRGAGVTVAIVDSGVASTHPDLAPQRTGNPGERGAGRERNGVDDDGNGLVDDWGGWDFVTDDNDPDDAHGHGTHVAGTAVAAAAAGDVVGVAPEGRVLPVRVLNASGSGTTADVAAAFGYAGRLGVRVVNASLGSSSYSQAERAAIHAYPDTLFVVAAGNGGGDSVGDDNDVAPQYPCAYDEPNVLCVGASDPRDRPAAFSNYGSTTVDLFAPGVDIVSTYPPAKASDWRAEFGGPAGYEIMQGTSMASPHAAGAAALVASAHPTWTPARIRQALIDTADTPVALAGRAVSDGRLDAAAALAWTAPDAEPDPAPAPAPAYVPTTPAATPTATPTATPEPVATPDPAPVVIPVSTPAPVVTPAPALVAAPVISGLRFVSRPRALSFSASPAGSVRLVAERRTGKRYKRVGSSTVSVSAGRQRIALRRTIAGARLRAGTWRVTLGTARVTFRVR